MSSHQYTIQAIPELLDRELRRRAEVEQKSLNTVILEALHTTFNMQGDSLQHTDLDFLIGSWEEDPAFDEAIAGLQKIDERTWQ